MTSWGGRSAVRLTAATVEAYGDRCHLARHGLCLYVNEGGTDLIDLAAPPRDPRGPSADHLTPRSLGGTDELGNLRPAHRRCNSGRRDRPLSSGRPTTDNRGWFT